ncbi:hypothetical protein BKM09_014475 [Pseudomonas amygdali pv. morsprunorum]|nr:TSUP family transporter [Pseudomonas amygdali]POY79853.1 hypothetical protein BKM09_014475 [Pseudomonas amygdali pv. morsprunorum]
MLSGVYLPLFVCVLTAVQSIFGVGLLFFGTPLLLLWGYTYIDAINILLPCSLFLSCYQVFERRIGLRLFEKRVIPLILVCVSFGMVAASALTDTDFLKPFIAALLVLVALLRLNPKLLELFRRVCRRYKHQSLASIGVVHGLTNMGGGLLTSFASSTFSLKEEVSSYVVVVYTLFAATQITTLVYLGKLNIPRVQTAILIACVFLVHRFIGRALFNSFNSLVYQKIFSIFLLLSSLMLSYQYFYK